MSDGFEDLDALGPVDEADAGGESITVTTQAYPLGAALNLSTVSARLACLGMLAGILASRGGVPVPGGVFVPGEHSPSGPGLPEDPS